MSDQLLLFRIRRKSDGQFSTGGTYPRYTKVGKFWKYASLKSHLSLVNSVYKPSPKSHPYIGKCEIVRYDYTEAEVIDII